MLIINFFIFMTLAFPKARYFNRRNSNNCSRISICICNHSVQKENLGVI